MWAAWPPPGSWSWARTRRAARLLRAGELELTAKLRDAPRARRAELAEVVAREDGSPAGGEARPPGDERPVRLRGLRGGPVELRREVVDAGFVRVPGVTARLGKHNGVGWPGAD